MQRNRLPIFFAGIACVVASLGLSTVVLHAGKPAPVSPVSQSNLVGTTMPDFVVTDASGTRFTREQLRDGAPLFGVIFFHPDCPCAVNCARSVAKLESGGPVPLRLVGVVSHGTREPDLPEKLDALRAEGLLPFPVLFDHDQSVRRIFQARRTPEVFLAEDNGRIAFWGAPENSLFPGSDGHRELLVEAVAALRSGSRPEVTAYLPIGCPIEDPLN